MGTEGNLIPEEKDEKRIRLIRPSVVVLCGAAACGKSTFAAQHFRPTQIISSDQARALVCDDESDQRFQSQAFALLHSIIEQRLGINRLCVVDSTALTQHARRSLLDLARRYRVPCVALLLDVPLATCLERDTKRERTVGAPAIERQYQMFEQVKATIGQEGFDQVIELRDQEMDKVQIEIVFRPVSRPAAGAARPEDRRPRPSRPSASRDQRDPARNRRWSGRERGPYAPPRSGQGGDQPSPTPASPNGALAPAPSAAPTPPAEPPAEPDKTPETSSGSQESE
jgi:predicted kinase